MSLRLRQLPAKLLDGAEPQPRAHGDLRVPRVIESLAKAVFRLCESPLGNIQDRLVNPGLQIIRNLTQVGLDSLAGLLRLAAGVVERRETQLHLQEVRLKLLGLREPVAGKHRLLGPSHPGEDDCAIVETLEVQITRQFRLQKSLVEA